MTTFQVLLILNDGAPLLVLKVPTRKLKRGDYTGAVKWSVVLKSSLNILKQHGLSRKNLLALDHVTSTDDPARSHHEKWLAAFAGDTTVFSDFHLYELCSDESVRLIRAAATQQDA